MTAERVLIVEDHVSTAADYARWLREAGYQVDTARAASEAIEKAATFGPDAILLDLQLPSVPDAADEEVKHGLSALEDLRREDAFRPIIVVTAHSKNRELLREVLQRTQGGQFVFKDDHDLALSLPRAVSVALAHPAYKMSRAVRAFRSLVDRDLKEDDYRTFIKNHWRELLGADYRDVLSPYEITRGGEIDLYAIRHDGFPDLWELKRPDDPLFREYNQWRYLSDACAKAVGQLMEYLDEAERTNSSSENSYERRKGVDVHPHRPRGFVVVGRYSKDAADAKRERDRLRLENRFYAGITIMTYDDLIERAERFIAFLQRYRGNGEGA